MEKKFTPGPWRIKQNTIYAGLTTIGQPEGLNKVCMVNMGGLSKPGGDPNDNLSLISSSPDMLEALESLTFLFEDDVRNEFQKNAIAKAKAAINKAYGKQ